jgi:drug/metabolite transporter (DMT)-like permease
MGSITTKNHGIRYMLLSTVFFTVMGVFVKNLENIQFFEIVFFRAAISLILCSVSLYKIKIPFFGKNKTLLILRGVTGAFALLLYFLTIQKLPFAVAVILQYLAPVFTVLLSVVFLHERPKTLQWLALIISFSSVFLINDFSNAELSVFFLLGITSALLSAIAYSSIRSLQNSEHPLVIVFYFALLTFIIALPFTLIHWKLPTVHELINLLAMGISAQLAQYCMTVAYQSEEASKVAHLSYLNIVWALLLGILFWHETISLTAYAGIILILTSCIVTTLSMNQKCRLSKFKDEEVLN